MPIDDVLLTTVELMFTAFLSLGGEETSPLAELLHLPSVESAEDPLLQIGLQTLAARGFAHAEGNRLVLDERVGAIGAIVARPDRCIGLLLSTPDRSEPSRVVEGNGLRAVLSPFPPQLQAIAILEAATDLGAMLAEIVRDHAAHNPQSTAAIVVEYEAGGAGERGLAIAQEGLGQFRCTAERAPGVSQAAPRIVRGRELDAVIGALLSPAVGD